MYNYNNHNRLNSIVMDSGLHWYIYPWSIVTVSTYYIFWIHKLKTSYYLHVTLYLIPLNNQSYLLSITDWTTVVSRTNWSIGEDDTRGIVYNLRIMRRREILLPRELNVAKLNTHYARVIWYNVIRVQKCVLEALVWDSSPICMYKNVD